MRRIIVFTLLALTLGSGAALADRDHHRRGEYRGDHRGGVTIRNPRDPVWHQRDRRVERDRRVVYRRPVYASNGYYQFNNGHRHRYTRPVIRQRYFDVRVRPQIIVENYQPVTGYIWVAGQWSWNGYEWIWTAGHYETDPGYYQTGSGYYEPSYEPASGYEHDCDDGVRY